MCINKLIDRLISSKSEINSKLATQARNRNQALESGGQATRRPHQNISDFRQERFKTLARAFARLASIIYLRATCTLEHPNLDSSPPRFGLLVV